MYATRGRERSSRPLVASLLGLAHASRLTPVPPSSPYREIVHRHSRQNHPEHRQRRPAAAFVDDRVREEVDRREDEQRGDERIERSTERRIVARALAQHEDRGDTEGIEG